MVGPPSDALAVAKVQTFNELTSADVTLSAIGERIGVIPHLEAKSLYPVL